MIHYPITPVPYTRINKRTPRDKPSVVKYNKFKADVKRYNVIVPMERPYLVFTIPTSDESLWGAPHRVTRSHDLDNLVKALFDACKIITESGIEVDDGHVADMLPVKYWGQRGLISVWQYALPVTLVQPEIQIVAPIETNNQPGDTAQRPEDHHE